MRKESAIANKARKEKAAQLATDMHETLRIMRQHQANLMGLPPHIYIDKGSVKSTKKR